MMIWGNMLPKIRLKKLIVADKNIKGAKIAILGVTFKENCPDTRNSKVIDIVKELKEYDINPIIIDPIADKSEAKALYGIEIKNKETLNDLDAIIIATGHEVFKDITLEEFNKMFRDKKIIIDVKGILEKEKYENNNYIYWRL